MYGDNMQPGDQQFINFQDYPTTNTASAAQVHVDLGTPNQQLFGHIQGNDPTGAAMMSDLQGFPGQKDGKDED